ncbi:MAG: hypothetical protein U1D30_02905 [Planctomycetota bacterium]
MLEGGGLALLNGGIGKFWVFGKETLAVAKAPVKENQFDERRETLVIERKTTFAPDLKIDAAKRNALIDAVHRHPADVKKLEYIRCPTGFIRHITVTEEDLTSLKLK